MTYSSLMPENGVDRPTPPARLGHLLLAGHHLADGRASHLNRLRNRTTFGSRSREQRGVPREVEEGVLSLGGAGAVAAEELRRARVSRWSRPVLGVVYVPAAYVVGGAIQHFGAFASILSVIFTDPCSHVL